MCFSFSLPFNNGESGQNLITKTNHCLLSYFRRKEGDKHHRWQESIFILCLYLHAATPLWGLLVAGY